MFHFGQCDERLFERVNTIHMANICPVINEGHTTKGECFSVQYNTVWIKMFVL